jgi:hypothetical protein
MASASLKRWGGNPENLETNHAIETRIETRVGSQRTCGRSPFFLAWKVTHRPPPPPPDAGGDLRGLGRPGHLCDARNFLRSHGDRRRPLSNFAVEKQNPGAVHERDQVLSKNPSPFNAFGAFWRRVLTSCSPLVATVSARTGSHPGAKFLDHLAAGRGPSAALTAARSML